MHKGVILIVKASDGAEAEGAVRTFMEDYQENDRGRGVWDWYVIGGRWSGTLNNTRSEFGKLAEEIVPSGEHGFVSYADVEKAQPALQAAWEALGETSKNPWGRDQYAKDHQVDDVRPLADCLEAVKDFHEDPIKAGKAEEERARKWLSGGERSQNGQPDWDMYGYVLGAAASLYQQEFSFECNVFNVESDDFSIPERADDYYAVIVDMHS